MKDQRIVRDIADRSGAAFGSPDSAAPVGAFITRQASPMRWGRSSPLANGRPIAPSSRNMAELKIHVDGLPVLFLFPIEDASPKRSARATSTDIRSLLSNTLQKIADGIRESVTQAAGSPSNPGLTIVEMNPEAGAVAVSSDAQTMLRAGPLELNLIDRTAKRGERQIDLRPREFRLLRYMMERSDELLTRAKLLHDVWNYKFVPQTNLVDVHMGRLRRKVDGPNEPAMIRSVRGAGFVLNASPLSQN
jgi:DNA-binding winged helix-turn-helix (wHTH) protein